jgi:hypothetical protein
MNTRFLHMIAGAAFLAACGGSNSSSNSSSALCDKAVNASTSLEQKIAPCLPPGTTASTNLPTDVQTCQSQIAQCNANDQAILSDILDCFNGLPTCSTATQTQFEEQASACATPGSGLSEACKTATGF